MSTSTFTLGGVSIDPVADDFSPRHFSERFGGVATLTLERRGVALPGLPDPWIGRQVTWTDPSGTTQFTGDVVSMSPHRTALGWTLTYQCLGWRDRLDHFPHTDSNTGIDTSAFNLTAEDPAYDPVRAGRTVGQILAAVLAMPAVAVAIDAAGVGNYTGLPAAPALPSATVADLAAMTVVPPKPVYFTGEKFGGAMDSFMGQYAPNYRWWIARDGTLRYLDLRTFAASTLTMGVDPVEPSELSRDVSDCYGRVVFRGQPIAIMAVLKLSNGDITENFTHDGFVTNSAAKAAWTPADFRTPGTSSVVGACTCTSTTTITLDPDDASVSWSSDQLDQSHLEGVLNLSGSTIADYTQFWSARVIANAALTAGSTASVTIDAPLPSTAYDHFTLSTLAGGGSVVWTRYAIANTDLWPRVAKQSTYPQPFINAGGGATLISTPLGCVLWSSSGSPPYNSFPLAFTYDSTTGNIHFLAPTYFVANNAAPADVWVALPIQTNPLTATWPADVSGSPAYDGTSHAVDGLARTLTVTGEFWRDPGQIADVLAYTSDLHDSVKDAVVEGSILYHGMYAAALTFGLALNVAGDEGGAFATGWTSTDIPSGLPVLEVEVEWGESPGDAEDFRTTAHVSNRRAHYSAEMFMHPARQFSSIGFEGDPYEGHTLGAVPPPPTPTDPSDLRGPGGSLPTSPADLGIPTDPGSYMQSTGLPTSPADMGLPTTAADLGIPTDPGEYL